ncbi:MAG TPA: TonB-dependent receptor [Vicinamibacterales bacterium]|jgi:iron complex outermembrane receptor protein
MTRAKPSFIGAVALGLVFTNPIAALAQAPGVADQPSVSEASIEQLLNIEVGTVFGASRYQQKVVDAPASVSIVTHEEIQRFGYRTLADVLRGVRGFYVTNDRNYSYLGVRGFNRPGDYNSRILVLLDGHRLNETIYDSAYIGMDFPMSVDLIERVEIVRGPSSSIYGTSAFFAVVNVVTKRASSLRALRGSVEGGSLGTRAGSATFGHTMASGAEFVLAGTAFASDGISSYTVPGVGIAENMDDELARSFFASASRKNWSVRALYSTRNKGIPTGAFGIVLDDRRSATEDNRGFIEVSYDGTWRGNGLLWRGSYDRYTYNGTYMYDLFEGDEPARRAAYADYAGADWLSSEVMLTRRVAKQHFLTGGIEYREHLRQAQWSGYEAEPRTLDRNDTSRAVAVYAQDEFTISPRLTLNAGVRHDEHSAWNGSTNLRAAVIVKPIANAAVKVLHGSAFRAPNPYELHYYENPVPLVPERIRTTEVVWEQYLEHRVRLSMSGFTYRARDLISQGSPVDPADQFAFGNLDEAHASGVELEAEGSWNGLHMLASYTHQRVHSHPGNAPLSNSPRHLTHARVTGPLLPRWVFFGAEGLYTGDRLTLAGNVAEGAFLGNLTLTSRELSRARISLTIGNLFNRSLVDPGAEEHPGDVIAQQGRTLRARLEWRF